MIVLTEQTVLRRWGCFCGFRVSARTLQAILEAVEEHSEYALTQAGPVIEHRTKEDMKPCN